MLPFRPHSPRSASRPNTSKTRVSSIVSPLLCDPILILNPDYLSATAAPIGFRTCRLVFSPPPLILTCFYEFHAVYKTIQINNLYGGVRPFKLLASHSVHGTNPVSTLSKSTVRFRAAPFCSPPDVLFPRNTSHRLEQFPPAQVTGMFGTLDNQQFLPHPFASLSPFQVVSILLHRLFFNIAQISADDGLPPSSHFFHPFLNVQY